MRNGTSKGSLCGGARQSSGKRKQKVQANMTLLATFPWMH